MATHEIVSSAEWTRARKALIEKEKELLRARDAVSEARRALPWERVEKKYVFDTATGEKTLSDLFAGRSQLVIYHFMYGPKMTAPCKSCSFWADSFDHIAAHLAARDVTFLAVSRGPLPTLEAFKKRLGWSFDWVSSGRSDFNYDYQASVDPSRGPTTYNYEPYTGNPSEYPGVSVFYKDDDGTIYHTYSTYSRGIDAMNVAYQYLDLVPKGRDEAGLPFTMAWVRFRDHYEQAPQKS
jgi:predicted dithiol-disulfide oxidoreductase (DUF899 family)